MKRMIHITDRLKRPIPKGKRYWIGIVSLIILVAIPAVAHGTWTFMVYMAGDNDLEKYAIDDFLEMASVVDSTFVNIVVQFDRIPGYDNRHGNWTACHRFKITHNMEPTEINAISDWGGYPDHGGGREVNMGDPGTLSDFVNWATTEYPATYYALILWNHGSGWRETMKTMGLDREAIKAVCYDFTSPPDVLYMSEVKRALINMPNKPDLIGFDACLMGMIEVAYHIHSYGSVMVGSEEVEPDCGWPYDDILTALVNNPGMSASTLGTQIVNDYMADADSGNYTQSAVDLSKINALASAVDSFAQALGYDSDIVNARTDVESYYYPEHIDLYHFAYLCQQYSPNSTIDSRAQTVMDNVTSAVIANGHNNTYYPNSHGLAIYFPESKEDYNSDYESVSVNPFSSTYWDEFLHNYYDRIPPPLPPSPPVEGESSGGKVCFIATAAYSGYPNYGSPITVLQRFRDGYLLTNAPGRTFVSCYERISPAIAKSIEDKEPLKAVVRFYLKPIVWGVGKILK